MSMPIIISLLIAFWFQIYKICLDKLNYSQLHKLKKDNSTKKEIFEIWVGKRNLYKKLAFIFIFINDIYLILYLFNSFSILIFIYLMILYMIIKDILTIIHLDDHYFMFILKWNNFLLKPFLFLLKPYVYMTTKIGAKINFFYAQDEGLLKVSKEDQILSLVEQDDKTASLEEEEKRMIQGIFKLDDAIVREIMIPRIDIQGIKIDSTFDEAISVFIKARFSRLPVYTQIIDKIVGIIHVKDFINLSNKNDNIQTLMHKPLYVPESKKLDELLNNFKNTKNHFAVVVDEYGGTSGIVTIEDILEEIVGEIQDEFDDEDDQEIAFDDNYCIELDARKSIIEINRQLFLKIPENDKYETLGGYIFSILGEIPINGTIIKERQFQFTILDSDDRKINIVKIEKSEEQK